VILSVSRWKVRVIGHSLRSEDEKLVDATSSEGLLVLLISIHCDGMILQNLTLKAQQSCSYSGHLCGVSGLVKGDAHHYILLHVSR